MNPLLQKFTRNAQATFYGSDDVPGSQTQVSAGDRGFGRIMRDAALAGIGVSVMASVAVGAAPVSPARARVDAISARAMKDVALMESSPARRTLVYFVEDERVRNPGHDGVTHAAVVEAWSQAELVQARKLTSERREARLGRDLRDGIIEPVEALQAAFPEITVMSRADAVRHAAAINADIVAEADAAPTAPGGRF